MKPRNNSVRPSEHEAVYTTIVGGRPPGSGTNVGPIPRGIEVLVKKASVDTKFKATLLGKRADAAGEIGLELTPPEAAMLNTIPRQQLEAIIAATKVRPESRRVFLGKVASLMLAAVGVGVSGCKREEPGQPAGIRSDKPPATKGIQPDRPETEEPASEKATPTEPVISAGLSPAAPESSQENQPSPSQEQKKPSGPIRGIQPDRPHKDNTE